MRAADANGAATGKIYKLSDAQLSDDGAAIPSSYTTHYFPERAVEQTLALGAHRKLFSYLTLYVEKDLELPINILGERVAFQVGTNQPGAWFRLQKFIPSVRIDPWAPVRGLN